MSVDIKLRGKSGLRFKGRGRAVLTMMNDEGRTNQLQVRSNVGNYDGQVGNALCTTELYKSKSSSER